MRITLLGTGTPAPSLARQCSGYLFEVGSDLLVMDHGPGAHHRLMERGFRATDVSHAFFSHLHCDHCLDYPRPHRTSEQPRRVPGPRWKAAATPAGSAGQGSAARRRCRRIELADHRRPRVARAALPRVPRLPPRFRRGVRLLLRRQRAVRGTGGAGQRLRRAHPHEPLLQRHGAVAGVSCRLRQPPGQRGACAAGRP
jgi:hypothetical protein